ncbi:MAG: hypothetical protein ABIP89_08890 [Polyangiaceae bacterium]
MTRNHGLVLGLAPLFVVLAGACSSSVTNATISDDGGTADDGNPSTGSDSGNTRKDGSAGDASQSDGSIVMTDGGTTDGASSDGASSDGTTTIDASTTDASVVDAADAGPLVCGPGTSSGFAPTWWPPSAFHRNLCTAAQTSALSDCFVGIPDQMTCDAFNADSANAACIACAVTQSTAPITGALVEDAIVISINTAGCVARSTGDVSATGCGAKRQAADQCESFVCAPSCPATDQQGFDDYIQCLSDADTSTCMTYATAATCVDADLQADGSATQCALTGASFNENAAQYITLFCGL